MSEELQDYDPFLGALNERLRDAQQTLYAATARRPTRWARLRFRFQLFLIYKWLDALLYAVASALLVSSVVLFALSWPWDNGKTDEQQVVVGCASVVALGIIILSAINLAIGRSADLGPGFTAGILGRARYWVVGATVAPGSAFLFWLASQRPDEGAATAAGLLAGGAFAIYWSLARNALAAADPLSMATAERRRLVRQVDRFLGFGGQLARSTFPSDMPSSVRDQATNEMRLRLALGPVRQLRSSARRMFASGQTDEGYLLFGAMVEAFNLIVQATDGAIGSYNGLPSELIEAADDFVDVAIASKDEFVAVQLVQDLARVARLPTNHANVAETRLHARGRVSLILDRYWDDDASRVGPTAAHEFGALVAHLVARGSQHDAVYMLQPLSEKILKAQISKKPHLGQPAMDGFIHAFGAMAVVGDAHLRRYYLREWREAAERLSQLKLLVDRSWVRPQDQLLPGRTVTGGVGLQSVVLQAAAAVPGNIPEISAALSRLVAGALPTLANADQLQLMGPFGDALGLLLCVALVVVHHRPDLSMDQRKKSSEEILDAATGWIPRVDETQAKELLTDPDLAELIWSLLIASGCIADDVQPVRPRARVVLQHLDLQEGELRDGYIEAFIAGLELVDGKSIEEVKTRLASLRVQDPYAFLDDGFDMRIGRLGWAPACNRNQADHYQLAPRDVDSWVLREIPDIGKPGFA